MSVAAAIAKEREMLKKIRFSADYVVDTSRISNSAAKGSAFKYFLRQR